MRGIRKEYWDKTTKGKARADRSNVGHIFGAIDKAQINGSLTSADIDPTVHQYFVGVGNIAMASDIVKRSYDSHMELLKEVKLTTSGKSGEELFAITDAKIHSLLRN